MASDTQTQTAFMPKNRFTAAMDAAPAQMRIEMRKLVHELLPYGKGCLLVYDDGKDDGGIGFSAPNTRLGRHIGACLTEIQAQKVIIKNSRTHLQPDDDPDEKLTRLNATEQLAMDVLEQLATMKVNISKEEWKDAFLKKPGKSEKTREKQWQRAFEGVISKTNVRVVGKVVRF